jgi:aminopeptidase N
MMAHETNTLEQIKAEVLPNAEQSFRASDFLSDEEQAELEEVNLRGKKDSRIYDSVDAFEAELLARFGWEAFQAWLKGDFEMEQAAKFMAAERAREKRALEPLATIILAANAGANNGDKNGHAPKSLRIAQDLVKQIHKQGEQ